MKFSILAISLVLTVAFVLAAGCTQSATPPVVTTTPVTSPVATPVVSQTTAPVQTVPQVGMGTPG
ncbi:MAG: hypothetical protein WCK53_07655, partial [Methanomicrobiales archaeon]